MGLRKRRLLGWLDALEPRLMLTVDSSLMTWSQPVIGQPAQLVCDSISLREVHELTGVAYAHQAGLKGNGQTVVVIDSGVAYDHVALGSGFGEPFRVVGGWDFSEENDADPYDDGPAGFHGTHVAGILGSSDPEHIGVAPEVDIVALRVFNDQGRGKLTWLESSLNWVIDNLNEFDHPITTVNVSIGTDWNSLTLPKYATLEDELQILYAAGVFVAVAAGNRFDPDVVGLSYPAASPSVVAAASWNADGKISDFSQRHRSVLVLPGEDITSTVPDFLEDFNGVTDDFYAASGTSMAAPYLAGASILVREAMLRAGSKDISVDAIKTVLEETAKELFDPVSGQTYRGINVKAAVKQILGTTSGKFVSRRGDTLHVHGSDGVDTIQVDDSGRIKVNRHLLEFDVNELRSIVIAGDGRDRIQFFNSIDRTRVEFEPRAVTLSTTDVRISANGFRQIQVFATGRDVTASFHGGIGLDKFVSKQTHSWMDGVGYLNYVRGADNVTATANDSLDSALFYDSKGNDVFIAKPTSASLQGPRHEVLARGFASVGVRAHAGGIDRATLLGSTQDDVARAKTTYTSLKSEDYFFYAEGFNYTTIVGNGGFDSAKLYDSDGDDHVSLAVTWQSMKTPSSQNTLLDFKNVHAFASIGHDTAQILGTVANESFTAKPTHSWMLRDDVLNYARGFDSIEMEGGGGNDFARLYDSFDDDHFVLSPQSASAVGATFQYEVSSMTRVHAVSRYGIDTIAFVDSAGRDEFFAAEKGVWMKGFDFTNAAEGFAHVRAESTRGRDRLVFAAVLAAIASNDEDLWFLDGHDFDVIARGFYTNS